jgi:hypothetical protein
LFREPKKLKTTTNNNYNQQLMTNMTDSSTFSSLGTPLFPCQKGTRRERHPDLEPKVVNAAAPIINNMVSVSGNLRPTASIIDNTPDQNKSGIDKGQTFTTTEGNQGSCDKNSGQAVTTAKTDAIVRGNGGGKEVWG